MKKAIRAAKVVALSLLLAGCQQSSSINAQVQEAIAEHLASRPGIDATRMLVEVESVTVQDDRAEADVVFRSRDNPESRMNYHYELRREEGRWKVEGGRPTAAESPHPQPGEGQQGSELPEGHPPAGGGTEP
jgi:hypothetical protein